MGPQSNGLSKILWLVMNPSLFTVIPLLISHFEHGHFTLAQTMESLKVGHALKSLSFDKKLVQLPSIRLPRSFVLSIQVKWKGGSLLVMFSLLAIFVWGGVLWIF